MTFDKGQSGNPEGRPKGIKDKRILFAEIIESSNKELLNKALEMALGGNEQMLKMFLERILPAKPKDNLVGIQLTGDTLTEKSNQVIEALNNQYITPSEAMDMMQTLAMQARVFDADELAKFIRKATETIKQLKKEVKTK